MEVPSFVGPIEIRSTFAITLLTAGRGVCPSYSQLGPQSSEVRGHNPCLSLKSDVWRFNGQFNSQISAFFGAAKTSHVSWPKSGTRYTR